MKKIKTKKNRNTSNVHPELKKLRRNINKAIPGTGLNRLAGSIGVAPATLMRIKKGKAPSATTFLKIRDYLERDRIKKRALIAEALKK